MTTGLRPLWGWIVWSIGVAGFPIGGMLVPRGPDYISLALAMPGARGLELWCVWAVAFALMFAGMVMLRNSSAKHVVIAQLAGSVIVATLTMIIPTADPAAYAAYGRWEAIGVNPWNPPPITAAMPNAEILKGIFSSNPLPSVYGPAFVGLEAAIYRLIPDAGFSTMVLIHRAVMLTLAALVTVLVRGRRIAYWGLNPLVMFEFALCGHNDAVMIALIAVSMRVPWQWAKGAAVACAGMVKFPALLIALSLRRRAAFAGALITIVTFAVSFRQAFTLGPVLTQSTFSVGSPRGVVEKLLENVHVIHADLVAFGIVAVIVLVAFLLCTKSLSRRNATAAGCVALFALSPVLHSWYITWPLMNAAWISRRLRIVVLVMSFAAWTLEIGTLSSVPLHLSTLGFWLPVIVAVIVLYRPRKHSTSPGLAFERRLEHG